MGKPAARLGDMTAHGGVVTTGNPTVLIGGQPAATVGDLHACPLCSPGPHVGGPVLLGAPTVLIGGRPAARMGDTCACAAPAPDVIVSGCPTVLVGAAGGAGGAAASAAAASAAGAALRPGTPGTGTTARPLSPWVGVGYADPSGRPVAGWAYHAEGGADARDGAVGTGGQVWCDGLAGGGAVDVGLIGVYGCRWERGEARVGEPVGMSARCAGVEDGELAHFEVWREAQGPGGAVERAKVWECMGEVSGGAVEAVRPFQAGATPSGSGTPNVSSQQDGVGEVADGLDLPMRPSLNGSSGGLADARARNLRSVYVVEVSIGGTTRARSGLLLVVDWAEVEVVGADGIGISGAVVEACLPSGEVRRVRTDAAGIARFEGVEPGAADVSSVELP